MDEMASRMRNSGNQLQLEYSVNRQLSNNATRINQLAQSIAGPTSRWRAPRATASLNDLLDKA